MCHALIYFFLENPALRAGPEGLPWMWLILESLGGCPNEGFSVQCIREEMRDVA